MSIAVETTGVLGPITPDFIRELGQLITVHSGDSASFHRPLIGVAAVILGTAATDRCRTDHTCRIAQPTTGTGGGNGTF